MESFLLQNHSRIWPFHCRGYFLVYLLNSCVRYPSLGIVLEVILNVCRVHYLQHLHYYFLYCYLISTFSILFLTKLNKMIPL
jgi:hypothetical protein